MVLRMTNHSTAAKVATEVRVQMARQKKTQADLAHRLGMNAHTAGRRVRGEVPFDVVELEAVARWLGVPVATFWPEDTAPAAAPTPLVGAEAPA